MTMEVNMANVDRITSAFARALIQELKAASTKPDAPPEWMTTKQVAAYVGLRPITLEIMRTEGRGPMFSKPAHNCVRYRKHDVDVWLSTDRKLRTGAAVKRHGKKKPTRKERK